MPSRDRVAGSSREESPMTRLSRGFAPFCLLAGLFVCLCSAPGRGSPEARAAIEAAYQKTCEAANLRFIDGIVSLRHDDFEAFAPDGKSLDLFGERDRYTRLFDSALSISKTYRILSFQMTAPGQAKCEVHEIYEIVKLDAAGRERPFFFESLSKDHWLETPRGWRIKATYVTRQRAGPRE